MLNTYSIIYHPYALQGSTQITFKTHEQTKKSSLSSHSPLAQLHPCFPISNQLVDVKRNKN